MEQLNVQEVKTKIENVLKNLKIDCKKFKPNYNCNKCNDTGEVDGKYCSCFYEKLNEQLIKNLFVYSKLHRYYPLNIFNSILMV